MPIKPPKSVTIGGVLITIKLDIDIPDWGQYISDNREILISVRALTSNETLKETLRHEMMHAALDIGGVSFMDKYSEECVVRCMDRIFWPAYQKLPKHLK